MRAAVLINQSAGSAERFGNATLNDRLVRAFATHGIDATVKFLPGAELPAAAEEAVRLASAGGLDMVVAGGGDGTLRAVASALVGTDIPLGVLPLGTLNHFAKDVGIPLDAEEAVAVIAAGHNRYVDTAEVNGNPFLNNSSVGLYPRLVRERERRRRASGMPKWLAAILVLPRVLRQLSLYRLRIRIGAAEEPCLSPFVFVSNNEYRLGLPELGRRARLDAGELAVYVAKAQDRVSLFVLACRLLFGKVEQARDVQILKNADAELAHARGACSLRSTARSTSCGRRCATRRDPSRCVSSLPLQEPTERVACSAGTGRCKDDSCHLYSA